MVNRLLREYRLDTVTDFSSPQALAALDRINDAKEEALDSRSWTFDQREGVIDTFAIRSGVDTAMSFTKGSTSTVGSTTLNSTIGGAYTVRCVPTNSTDRSQTSHRVEGAIAAGGIVSFLLADAFSGTTGSYSVDAFSAEYQFPSHTNGDSYVKRLLSMTHQERPLRLEEVGRNFRFDMLITRVQDTLGSDPEIVYFGRPVWNTHTTTSSGSTYLRDGFMIWPVPTSSERLDYTYLYRHAPLSAITDTLANVPDSVINAIVELAYGFSLNTKMGNDPSMADRVIKAAITRIERLHAADRRTPYRSKPVRSLDDIGRDTSTGRRISSDLITGY